MKRVKGFDVPVDRINPLTRIDIYIDTFQFWMLVLFSLFPDEVWAIPFIKQMPPEHLLNDVAKSFIQCLFVVVLRLGLRHRGKPK